MVHSLASFIVIATMFGESQSIYGDVYWLDDMSRDIFKQHGWHHGLRIGPPSS
jgi:hypothetical protein